MDTSECPENFCLSLDSYFSNDKLATQYDPNDPLIEDLFGSFSFESRDPPENEANHSEVVIKEQTNGLDSKSESESEIESEITPSKPIISQVTSQIGQFKQQYRYFRDENFTLKNENSELKNKINELENENSELNDEVTELQERLFKNSDELTSCEKEFSTKLSEWYQLKKENEALKSQLQIFEEEKITLQIRVEQKEAELKQFKDLVQKQITDEEEIQALKKELTSVNKSLKKAERTNQLNFDTITAKSKKIRSLRKNQRKIVEANKKIMNILLEFASILDMRKLLTGQKKRVLNNLIANMNAGNFDLEELNGGISDEETGTSNGLAYFSVKKEDISEEKMFNCSFNGEPNASNLLMSSTFETSVYLNGNVQKSNFSDSVLTPVSCKIENTSSNENTENNAHCGNSYNFKDFSYIFPKLHSMYSDSLKDPDDFSFKIPYIKIFKDEERPISPIKPLLELDLPNESAKTNEDNLTIKEFGNIQEIVSPTEPSSDCQKNLNFPQTSSCSEADIAEDFENKIRSDKDAVIEKEFSDVQKPAEPSSVDRRNSLSPQKASCSEIDLAENFYNKVIDSDKDALIQLEFSNVQNQPSLKDQSPVSQRNSFSPQKLCSEIDPAENFDNKINSDDNHIQKELKDVQKYISSAEPPSVKQGNSLLLQKSSYSKIDLTDFDHKEISSGNDTPLQKEFSNSQKSISLAEPLSIEQGNSLSPQKSSSSEIDITEGFDDKEINSDKDTLIEKECCNDSSQKDISLLGPSFVSQRNSPQKLRLSESDLTDFNNKKFNSHEDSLKLKEFNDVQKDISGVESVTERISHLPQRSSCFEVDHTKDFENISDLNKLLPSNFHFVSSSYSEDNKHILVHLGNGVLNCLVNTEKKLGVCSLDIHKQTVSSSIQNNNIVAVTKERMDSILDLYYATEKHVTAVGRQILNSDSSQQFKSHFHVVFESKNDIISTNCDPKNISKYVNSCEIPKKEKPSNPEQVLSHANDDDKLNSSGSFEVSPTKSPLQSCKIQGIAKTQESRTFPMPVIVKTVGNYDSTDEVSSFKTLEVGLEANVPVKKFEEVKHSYAENTGSKTNDTKSETIVSESSNFENNFSSISNEIHVNKNSTTKVEYTENKTSKKENVTMNVLNISDMTSLSQNKTNLEKSQNLGKIVDSNPKNDFSIDGGTFNGETLNSVITSVNSDQKFSLSKQTFSNKDAEFIENNSLDNFQESQSDKTIKQQQNCSVINPLPSKTRAIDDIELFTDIHKSPTKKQKLCSKSLVNPLSSKTKTVNDTEFFTDIHKSSAKKQKLYSKSLCNDNINKTVLSDSFKSALIGPLNFFQSSQNCTLENSKTVMQSKNNSEKKFADLSMNITSKDLGDGCVKSNTFQLMKLQSKKLPKNTNKVLKNNKQEEIVNDLSIVRANQLLGGSKKRKTKNKNKRKKKPLLDKITNSPPVPSSNTVSKIENINTSRRNLYSKECNLVDKKTSNENMKANKQKSKKNYENTTVTSSYVKELQSESSCSKVTDSVPLPSYRTVEKIENIYVRKENLDNNKCSVVKRKTKEENVGISKQKVENIDVNTCNMSVDIKELKGKSSSFTDSLNIQSHSHVTTVDSGKVSNLNELDSAVTTNKVENIFLASSESSTSATILDDACRRNDSINNQIKCNNISTVDKQSNNDLSTNAPLNSVDNIVNLNSKTSPNVLTSEQTSIVLPISYSNSFEHYSKSVVMNDLPLKDEDTIVYSPTTENSDSNNISSTLIHSSPNERSNSQDSVEMFNQDINGRCSDLKAVVEKEISNESVNDSVKNVLDGNETNDLQIKTAQTRVRHNSFQSNISEDENPLVIVEEIEEKKDSDSEGMFENCVDNSDTEPIESAEEKKNTSGKNRTKKRKKSKSSGSKKKKRTCDLNEEPAPVLHPIIAVLEEIKKIKIEDILSNHSRSKLLVHSLINVLINPSNSPSTITVLFHIFSYLSSSKLNPLISFFIKKDESVFLPPSEHCIVEALIKVDRKKKNHLEGLLTSAITTLYYLVLEKKNISKTGLAAFCRIFTHLCKYLKNSNKPMKLCCDLVKRSHQFAPFLIANIIGVWKDLFAVKEDSKDYELLLQSCIAYGVQKKPSTLNSNDWKQCRAVISEFLVAPAVPYPIETAKVAIDNLKNILNGIPTESDFVFIEPLAIFSAVEGEEWAWKNVVQSFVLPSLATYATKVENERAFSVLLDIYAEIGMHVADEEKVGARGALFKLFIMKDALPYVKPISARFLLKISLFKKIKLDKALTDWIAENEKTLKGTSVELCVRRQLIADEPSFTEKDIICES